MRSINGRYLLSMIDHKSTYDLSGVEISIVKNYENNLRERNPQLGKVEVLCDDNPLKLEVGDVVAVHHFVFYGDIGPDKSFLDKDNVDGLYPCSCRQIFFRYNHGKAEALGEFEMAERVYEVLESKFLHIEPSLVPNKAMVGGVECMVLDNSMYLVTLGKRDYYRVRSSEIVMRGGIAEEGWMIVEYLPEPIPIILGKPTANNVRARCLTGKYEGMELQVYRNQGVRLDYGKYIIDDNDMILWVWNDRILAE